MDKNRISGASAGRAGYLPRSPYPSKVRSVDPAAVHGRRLSLPQEICSVSLRRLRLSRGSLTAGQKSAEGKVGHDVGKASKELFPTHRRISYLRGRLILYRDQVVAQLFGLSLNPCFQPFFPLSVFGRPDGFVVLDLVLDHRVEDDCNLMGGRRDRPAWPQLGFHPAQVVAHGGRTVVEGRSSQTE